MRKNRWRALLGIFLPFAMMVTGLTAGTAGATPLSGHWTGVTSTPGTVQATSLASILDGILTCEVVLDVDITDTTGGTNVWGADVNPGDANCAAITPNLDWPDQFCAWVDDDPLVAPRIFDRIEVDFNLGMTNIAGPVFAELNSAGTAFSVNSPIGTSGHTLVADGTGGSLPYSLDNAITVAADENSECSWATFPPDPS